MLTLYVLERFLARLEASAYADRFVLKGGMLLAVWDARRATVDADFLVRDIPVQQAAIVAGVVQVARAVLVEDDGVEFLTETATSSTIRDGNLYGGVRVAMDSLLAGARVKLRLDISTGDPVVPPPDVIVYPTLRSRDRDLRILGYPLPVVLAEKLCTALSLGAGNSRVRDYADVWTLTGLHDISAYEMTAAVRATADYRGTDLRRLSSAIGDFAKQRSANYTAYLRRLGPDATTLPTTLASLVHGVVSFADPVLAGALEHGEVWRCSDRRWDGQQPFPSWI